MTAHAGLHGGDTGLLGLLHRKVAVLALDLVLTCVDVVAEENRLARSGKPGGITGGKYWSGE